MHFVLRAVSRGRLYGLAYTLADTPEEAFAGLRFALHNLYAAMLELLIHTGMKNSPSRDRETARAIANPTNAKGIIGRLHNLANQVEDAALNCEKMRTEAVDFDISTMLEESPRIRLEPPPQDVRREGSAGEPGDNDDSDDDYYYDEDEDMDRLDWLSSLPYSKHHDKVKRRRTRGTCDWLLQRVEFNNWQDGPQSASLWLQGSCESSFLHVRYLI